MSFKIYLYTIFQRNLIKSLKELRWQLCWRKIHFLITSREDEEETKENHRVWTTTYQ